MASTTNKVTFNKAVINLAEGTITEINKNDVNVYRIESVLKDWDGIENISITIQKNGTLPIEE